MTETNLVEDLRLLAPPSYDWALGLALALVAATALVWILRRSARPRHEHASTAAPDAAAWNQALSELERLTPLLCPDRSREYGIASTTILRRYLEARYGLRAPLQTTEEFLVNAASSPRLPAADRDGLAEFLRLCDLFKFGRFVASAAELGQLHAAAVAFVLRSQPAPAAAPTEVAPC